MGTVIGTPVPGGSITGIDFTSNGTLYGFLSNGVLVTINPTTGALNSTIGQVTLGGNAIQLTDMAIQPGTNTIFGTTVSAGLGQNTIVTVNPVTAIATVVGNPGLTLSFLSIAFSSVVPSMDYKQISKADY